MQKHLVFLLVALVSLTTLRANPVDQERARVIGQKFAEVYFHDNAKSTELQLVYTGISQRGETCFYAYNVGSTGFVIVSADDRFRPIVGYSEEGIFETENMSPELAFYLDRIIEARTSRNAVMIEGTEQEWQSLASAQKMRPRNNGKGEDFLCQTKWNQDSPYNLYAPQASGGPGGRCYAGCVATAMSQVMKYWDHPLQGTGSHSYYSWGGYGGQLWANFGATTYDWENMPNTLAGASDEEIDAVATLMYHCAIAVEMSFSPNGSGANSWSVPGAIRQYFSYSSHASLKDRDSYSLSAWQNMLKESIDLGWPLYYSGQSNDGGHAFVCDGYDKNDLFHYNWGWGGSSDGWFVVDEIDYATWAQAVFNYVPADVYDYMPKPIENLSVVSHGDTDYSATITWTNPTQNIHNNNLTTIDQVVISRNGKVVHTIENAAPGATLEFTDHFMPTVVTYAVHAVVHNAKGLDVVSEPVSLGPTCGWTLEMTSSKDQGWESGSITALNTAGAEITTISCTSAAETQSLELPLGHVTFRWNLPTSSIDQIGFSLKNNNGQTAFSFEGPSSGLAKGVFFVLNNTCGATESCDMPQNLIASINGNNVNLQWGGNAGSTHYCIYRDGAIYDLTDETTFTDENASQIFHSYYVTALCDDGESDASNICNTQPGSECIAPTGLRYELLSSGKIKVSWNECEGAAGYILYRRTKGNEFKRLKLCSNTSYSDNPNTLGHDIIDYAVSAYYAATSCESAYGTTEQHPELNFMTVNRTIIPTNLTYNLNNQKVNLLWDEALMADSYTVFRNGEIIAEGLTDNAYTDNTATAHQSYYYTVKGKTQFMESNHSNRVDIDWTLGMDEDSTLASIYPNPTTNSIVVECDDMSHISIFNTTGQKVMDEEAQSGTHTLNLSHLPQGTYFLQITGAGNSFTEKIIKL